MASVDPIVSVGNLLPGAIIGKFEHGYLVTVTVGSEQLRGVIYHLPPGPAPGPQHANIPSFMLSSRVLVDDEGKYSASAKGRKHKERAERKKDPKAPRCSRTGYNFFFADERAKLKLMYPEREREYSRMIGDAWNGSTEEQKRPYLERGAKDKERYESEMRDYRQMKSSDNLPQHELVRPAAGGGSLQVESKSTVPITPRQFVDPCHQQLENSSQWTVQQPLGSMLQSCTETPSLSHAAVAVAGHEKAEAHPANACIQPEAQQFMKELNCN